MNNKKCHKEYLHNQMMKEVLINNQNDYQTDYFALNDLQYDSINLGNVSFNIFIQLYFFFNFIYFLFLFFYYIIYLYIFIFNKKKIKKKNKKNKKKKKKKKNYNMKIIKY